MSKSGEILCELQEAHLQSVIVEDWITKLANIKNLINALLESIHQNGSDELQHTDLFMVIFEVNAKIYANYIDWVEKINAP